MFNAMQVIKITTDLAMESVDLLCEKLKLHTGVPIRAADAAALTGLPLEISREGLLSLAIRNNARVTQIGNDYAYIFSHVSPSGRRSLPPSVRKVGGYLGDLLMSQFGYLLGAVVLIGPFFVGARMLQIGNEMGDLFYLVSGGTIALATLALLFKLLVRSISVVLPPVVLAGIGLGWERWGAEDVFWIPLAVAVAIGLQLEVLWNYRKLRPKDPIALFLWGRTLTSPVLEHKRVVELIVSKGGTITTAELMRVFGWTVDQASEQLSNVLAQYDGDVAVDPNGQIFVFFEELARTHEKHVTPEPSYVREIAPPGPFEGLDLRWVSAASVACWLAIVASPMNPAYTRFVQDIDITLSGNPFLFRVVFAGFCVFPLMLYATRILLNIMERGDFAKRRRFLDALAYADAHAEGSFIAHDKFSTADLVDLGAEIDENRGVQHAIWVSFPALIAHSPPPQIQEYFLDLSEHDSKENVHEAQTSTN